MAKAVCWKFWESTRAKVLWTGQLSQADPSMVKVQVRSHYQCVGGGVQYVAGKTKRSGDWDKEGHIRVHLNIEQQQSSQPTKELTNPRPGGLRIWYNTFKEPRNRFPGINSASLIHVAWRAGTINRVVVPARQAENRFLGSLKGLKNRPLYCYFKPSHPPYLNSLQKGI
jgi:hypothetical protein